MWKKVKAILMGAKTDATLFKSKHLDTYQKGDNTIDNPHWEGKHVYITSDEEIREGDNILSPKTKDGRGNPTQFGKVIRIDKQIVYVQFANVVEGKLVPMPKSWLVKIIASSDKSLSLPGLSEDFIRGWVNVSCPEDIEVEYKELFNTFGSSQDFVLSVSVDDSVNCRLLSTLDSMGEKIVEYTKKYEGTPMYDEVMKAIEFGYALCHEYYTEEA